LAQLEYTYQINAWQAKGVPFKDHVYVPEIHPNTGMEFCERKDDGHILKVNGKLITSCFLICLALVYWSELKTGWTTKFAARKV